MSMILKNPVAFSGGVQLSPHKTQSLELPIETAKLPSRLVIPLRQHIGTTTSPLVDVGEKVLKGQEIAHQKSFITAPVHASSSGRIVEIADYPVPTPSGQPAPCIVIETDGKDEWIPHDDFTDDPYKLQPAEIHDMIHAAGIVGLGGAGFPTAVKMLPGLHFDINLLVINAAECEPYISCDEALIRKNAEEIILGVELIRQAVQAQECVIGIEDNKTEAINALNEAIEQIGETSIELKVLPPVYPTGSEKQLIKSLTGLEIPSQGLPLDLGIVCYNVGTAYAVYRAIMKGEPLLSRIVTITGNAVAQPRNMEVLIGTPIEELFDQCGGLRVTPDRYLIGGPMMGYTLEKTGAPVIKTTNCIIAATAEDLTLPRQELPCIRCGDCARSCPIELLPQQLYWYARANDQDKLKTFKLFDCIECGCCSYVCPSHIPLVKYYQTAKAEIWQQEKQLLESDKARLRYESRQERLADEEQEKNREKQQTRHRETLRKEIDEAVSREKSRRSKQESDSE